MLANRKQEWVIEPEQNTPSSNPCLPQPNGALRSKCLIMVAMVAAIAIFGTVRSEAIIRAGYDLVRMKAQVMQLEKENEQIQLDIAKLKAPQRIQQIATTQLGMVLPQNVYCAANTSIGDSAITKEEKSFATQVLNAVKTGKAEASKGR